MLRFWLRSWSVLVVMATMIQMASAQPPRNPPPSRPAPTATRPAAGGGPAAMQPSKYLMIPGLMPLSMEGVQQEIGLSGEQKQQLKAISNGYQMAVQKAVAPLREMSEEEQKKAAVEVREQVGQMARSTQRKAEAVLSPQQLHAVQTIAFKLSAGQALTNPAAHEKLGLTPEQKQMLMAVYEKANEKMQKLQRESAEQILQLLNEEQVAKLHQMMEAQQKPQP